MYLETTHDVAVNVFAINEFQKSPSIDVETHGCASSPGKRCWYLQCDLYNDDSRDTQAGPSGARQATHSLE